MGALIPSGDERRLLGRFYWATLLAEIAHWAMPFQVLLVVRYLGQAQLGIVLGIEQLVELAIELPSGAWADRFGRKRCVLAGHALAALGWIGIPAATLLGENERLIGVCAAFAVLGAGTALVSGALEAWVVDNLHWHERPDLAIRYFGRERSLAAAGGIGADLLALGALALLIDMRVFWIVTGIGELVALGILWRTPEHLPTEPSVRATGTVPAPRIASVERSTAVAALDANDLPETDAESEEEDEELSTRAMIARGCGVIFSKRALAACVLALVWVAMSFGTVAEAFQVALADAALSERGFGWLELGVDCVGIFAPLAAVWLAGRLGSRWLLALGIVVPAAVVLAIGAGGGLLQLAAVYLMVVAGTQMFHTVADDFTHQLIPSRSRATASSAINLFTTIAMLISTGWLALLLARLDATSAVTVMGLATLPSALLFIPFFSRTLSCKPQQPAEILQ